MSSSCQHVFCRACIHQALALSPTCPIDRSRLALPQLVRAPRIIHQIVNELRVLCPHREIGCAWAGERERLADHLKSECSTPRKGKAVQRDGPPPVCPLCHDTLGLSAAQVRFTRPNHADPQHSESCAAEPTACPHCAEALLHRSLLPNHLLRCPSVAIPCPHASHGCTARLPRDQMHEDHLELSCPYEPLKEFLGRYDERMLEVENENSELRTRVGGLEEGMREMRDVLDGIRSGLGNFYAPTAAELERTAHVSPSLAGLSLFDSTSSPALRASPLPTFLDMEPLRDDGFGGSSYSASPAAGPAPLPPTSLLSATLDSISTSIHNLSSEFEALDARQNENLLIQDDTLNKFAEDIGAMRGVVHGMRMQMHHLLMELGRMGTLHPQQGGFGLNRQQLQQQQATQHDDGTGGSENSDDEQGQLPSMMLPRFMNQRGPFFAAPPPIYGTSGSSSGSNSSGNGMMGGIGRRFSQQETKL